MFTLPNLPFEYDSLNPYISSQTLTFHHDKHHKTYVDKLNEVLKDKPEFLNLDIVALLKEIPNLPQELQAPVLNNGGQHFNHSLYWEVMAPASSSKPSSELMNSINETFGGLEQFQEQFNQAGITQFGSGWAWLSVDNQGKLVVEKTSNADNPVVHGRAPILTMDVWEHAYYLDYQNKRPDYIKSWWNVVNWDVVSSKYAQAIS